MPQALHSRLGKPQVQVLDSRFRGNDEELRGKWGVAVNCQTA